MWGFAPETPPTTSSTPLHPPLWWSEHFTGPPSCSAGPPVPSTSEGIPSAAAAGAAAVGGGSGSWGAGGRWGLMVPPPELYFSPPQVSFSSNFVYLEMGSFLCLLYGGGTMREMSIKNTSG